jgi:transcriptional antiterminator Rof (Rho-off)
MVLDKVVARFKDGSFIKGNTKDFSSNKNEFYLELINGEIKKIDIEKLKALFCLKSFEGNKSHIELYTDVIPKGGRKILV